MNGRMRFYVVLMRGLQERLNQHTCAADQGMEERRDI